MPDNDPGSPEADTPDGVSGQSSRLTKLVNGGSDVLTPPLPTKLVDRGGRFEAASAAADPTPTQAASVVVEKLQQQLPPVLLGKEGHRLPRLMRSFLSTCLLRMDAKEGAGKGLDSVGNNEQMEDAVLGLMAAHAGDERIHVLFPDDTQDHVNALARLRFLNENVTVLETAAEVARGALVAQQHVVNAFIRDAMGRVGNLEALSPRLRNLLLPARTFVSGPAQKGHETRLDREKAYNAGFAKAQAEAVGRSPTGADAAKPPTLVINATPVVEPAPAAPTPPAAPDAASRRRNR